MFQRIKAIAREQRHNEFFWRYGFNFRPLVNYKFDFESEAMFFAKKMVDDLNRDGIAMMSIDDLLTDRRLFHDLETAVETLLENRKDELELIRSKANDTDAIGDKTFNVELLGSEVEFDPDSIFAQFALNETFIQIANAYFGMLVKLRYYNVWQTFATNAAARESQLWHFDREDNYILKIFLYLNDVGEGAGPFTYAPKTHRKGLLWGKQPEYSLEKNVMRSTDEQMSAVVPREHWVKGIGKKGTIIFADTRGFHKGGEARTDDRLMFTAMFTSPASDSKRLLHLPKNVQTSQFSKKQICALEIK
jgi:Phytanoyl-CoA dioxygenase (PhyH)